MRHAARPPATAASAALTGAKSGEAAASNAPASHSPSWPWRLGFVRGRSRRGDLRRRRVVSPHGRGPRGQTRRGSKALTSRDVPCVLHKEPLNGRRDCRRRCAKAAGAHPTAGPFPSILRFCGSEIAKSGASRHAANSFLPVPGRLRRRRPRCPPRDWPRPVEWRARRARHPLPRPGETYLLLRGLAPAAGAP